jgi:hypothetical protein
VLREAFIILRKLPEGIEMGGIFDSVTKAETWDAFQSVLQKLGENSDGSFGAGLYLSVPTNKKDAFKQMVRKGSGWVLPYHLHT